METWKIIENGNQISFTDKYNHHLEGRVGDEYNHPLVSCITIQDSNSGTILRNGLIPVFLSYKTLKKLTFKYIYFSIFDDFAWKQKKMVIKRMQY